MKAKTTTVKHEGRAAYRLIYNPEEAVFAAEWAKINEHTTTNRNKGQLDWLLHGDGLTCFGVCDQQEAMVAATVIQWLGSPVGSAWLKDTLGKIKL